MKLKNHSFLLLLALLLFATAQAQQPAQSKDQSAQPQQPPKPAKLTGRVLRADDRRPIPKATVTLWPEAPGQGGGTLSVRTNSSGVYEFAEVAPGSYRMRAGRTGYVTEAYGQSGGGPGVAVVLQPGGHLGNIDMWLQRAGVIAGTITDEDNEAVEGLAVRAQRVRFFPGGRQQTTSVRSDTTNDLGEFRLSGLAPGSYYIQAGGREGASIGGSRAFSYAPAFYPGVPLREEASRAQVAAASEIRGIDIQVHSAPTYTITGYIIDATPAAGRKNYSIGFATDTGWATTSAEQSGRFTLRGVEPGEYTVMGSVFSEGTPTRRGYRSVRVVDADISVVIEVGRQAEVKGEARVEGGGEFSFDRLFVSLRSVVENAPGGGGQIEDSGAFRARDIPEGSYTFELMGRETEVYLKEAKCEGEDYLVKPLTLVPDQVLERCSLVIARDVAEAGGFVTDADDKPVAGAVVVLIPQEPERRKIPRHTHTAQTDKNGQFLLRGVIPGDYFAFAVFPREDAAYYDLEFPNRNEQKAERVTVKPSEPLAMNLKLLAQPR